jgi:hypothetical protein
MTASYAQKMTFRAGARRDDTGEATTASFTLKTKAKTLRKEVSDAR